MFKQVDLVLVEGFKRDAIPKIEVRRELMGKPELHPHDPHVVATIGDIGSNVRLPHATSNDIAAVADLVLALAAPIEVALRQLGGEPR